MGIRLPGAVFPLFIMQQKLLAVNPDCREAINCRKSMEDLAQENFILQLKVAYLLNELEDAHREIAALKKINWNWVRILEKHLCR